MKKKVALFALASLFYGLSSHAQKGPEWNIVNKTKDEINVMLYMQDGKATGQRMMRGRGRSKMMLNPGSCLQARQAVWVNGMAATPITRGAVDNCTGGTIEIDKKWDSYSARDIYNYMIVQ